MDNKRNSERDKILEDILNDVSSDRIKAPQNKNVPPKRKPKSKVPYRKKVNPSAYQKPEDAELDINAVKTVAPDTSNKTLAEKNVSSEPNPTSAPVNKPSAGEILAEERNKSLSGTKKLDTNLTSESTEKGKMPDNSVPSKTGTMRPSSIKNNDEPYQKNVKANPNNPARKRRRKKKRSARVPVVLIITTLILTVSICLSMIIIAVGRDMLAIGKDESLKMVTIPEGADTAEVASILEKEGIISVPKAFEIVAGMSDSGTSFIPGQYELSPSYAYETIINKLTTKPDINKETVDITFVEGTSLYEAAQLLAEKKVCDAERFLYYFNAGGYGFDFEEKLPKDTASKFYRMEGYLWPDTYKFYVDSDPESVCMKIYQNFEDKMTDKYYKQMKKKGMSLDEVITLASIVQAEAPDIKSMKMVASVFENRLADPDEFPMLQSDPTTYYVEEIIKPNIQVPSTEMFDAYDTYKAHGLPQGAIGNPGADAIEAVLFPEDTDYLYFAADIDTKEIFYAKTLEEHEENLAEINGESDEDDEDTEEEYDY